MSWLSELFGDQSKGFEGYGNAMRGIGEGYNPYIQRGTNADNMTFDQYQQLINNPNFLQDQIVSGFQTSPYQDYLLKNITKGMNMNATNTGMLGSGAANEALQGQLTGQMGQFLNDYIGRGMNSYGMGMQGLGNFGNRGYDAFNRKSGFQQAGAEGDLQAERSRQAAGSNLWGTAIGALGSAIGGPIGDFAQSLGKGIKPDPRSTRDRGDYS